MQSLPRELVERLAALPDGQPMRIIIDTDGKHAWQIEVMQRHKIRDAQACIALAPILDSESTIL
jgi:hypothetical protein